MLPSTPGITLPIKSNNFSTPNCILPNTSFTNKPIYSKAFPKSLNPPITFPIKTPILSKPGIMKSKIISYKRKNNKDAAIPKHPLDKDNKKSGNQSDSGIDRLVGLATTGDTYGGGGGA